MRCLPLSKPSDGMIYKEKVVNQFGNLLLVTDEHGMIVESVVSSGLGGAFYESASFFQWCRT